MARVLVVDDEPDIRTLVRIALERAGGLEVEAVGSGAAAIEAIEAAAPEVVLLDVMMPGLDGLATLERIRDLLASMPEDLTGEGYRRGPTFGSGGRCRTRTCDICLVSLVKYRPVLLFAQVTGL